MLELININQLDKFKLDNGDLFKGININEDDYKEFGELYFSFINFQSIKAWKRHTKMHMNLFVPVGDVKFVFFCEQSLNFREIEIGENNYNRISVPPTIWFGFKGLSKGKNLVVNFASIVHSDNEVEKLNIMNDKIKYDWSSS